MNIDLKNLTIEKAHKHLVDGDFTVRELASEYLKNIEVKNKDINGYLEVFSDVLLQADNADLRFKNGEIDNMLLGIPMALKDNLLVEGRRVTCASKIMEGYIAPYSATAIQKLIEKGVVFLGRANMDEFAMGASTENSAYGVTKNPHNLECVAGGSSGGSAAVVSADLALCALGSDTGGSIRQPGSFCGVVGYKPSYGAVSRHGLVAMSSSLDQIGPLTKSVQDAKIIFDCIRGVDGYDATTISINETRPLKKKIGIVKGLLDTPGINSEVKMNFEESIKKVEELGFEIVELEMPNISHSLEVYYIICPAEVSSNMSRFDGMRFGKKISGSNLLEEYLETRGQLLGSEVKRRVMIGTYVLSSGYYDAFYGKANKARELIKKDFERAFESVDVVMTPTTPSPAFKIGEKSNDPLQMYLADIFTVTANIAGIPAISLPNGSSKDGLPFGLQFMGAYKNDTDLFGIAKEFEVKL
ncbi:MAG: Asp-tRNA(Asn)/Glu-tRNA(Gln) amidotransferase subunit GatA [Patescibacteria group bacterium]